MARDIVATQSHVSSIQMQLSIVEQIQEEAKTSVQEIPQNLDIIKEVLIDVKKQVGSPKSDIVNIDLVELFHSFSFLHRREGQQDQVKKGQY